MDPTQATSGASTALGAVSPFLAAGNPYIAAGSAALGLVNTIAGFSGLKKQPKLEAYKEDPAMRAARLRADEMAQRGYTSAERASFESNTQRRYNTADQRIMDTAGSLGGALAGVIGANRTGADLQFAAQDAALKRQNIQYADRFAQNLQRLNEKNTESRNQERARNLQAYGQAAQSGLSQLGSAVNAFGATGGFQGMFGGGRQAAPGADPAGAAPAGAGGMTPTQRVEPQFTAGGLDVTPPQGISDFNQSVNPGGLNVNNQAFSGYEFMPNGIKAPEAYTPMDFGFGPVLTPPMMSTMPNLGYYNPTQ